VLSGEFVRFFFKALVNVEDLSLYDCEIEGFNQFDPRKAFERLTLLRSLKLAGDCFSLEDILECENLHSQIDTLWLERMRH
jgi:hypothetical protein